MLDLVVGSKSYLERGYFLLLTEASRAFSIKKQKKNLTTVVKYI